MSNTRRAMWVRRGTVTEGTGTDNCRVLEEIRPGGDGVTERAGAMDDKE